MNSNQKRLLISIINAITIFTMVVTMTIPVSDFANTVGAQDATEDPAAATTEEATATQAAPTETATAVPTTETPTEATPEATATEEATLEATADVTGEPTAEVTGTPTEEVTAAPTAIPPLFQDDFQDGDAAGWLLAPDQGWQIVSEADGNLFLSSALPGAAATITALTPADYTLIARARVQAGDKATFAFGPDAAEQKYSLTMDLSAANVAILKRGEVEVGQIALLPPAVDASGQPLLEWHQVAITAAGNMVSVTIDTLPALTSVDPNPLTAGAIIFGSDAGNSGSIALDDVVINTASPIFVTPTATPNAEATETAQPTAEVTPEATDEPIGVVILSADFESELVGWAMSEGAAIQQEGDGNHALLLTPGMNFIPAEPIYLADFRLDARVWLTSPAPNSFTLAFRTQEQRTYALSFEDGQTVLSRNDNDGQGLKPLASSPTAHALDAWHSLSLEARGGHLVVTIDDATEIDVTEAEPLLSGEIAFVANAGNMMLDDITVTDYSGTALMSATAEPMGLSEAELAKLPPGLLNVMDLFIRGNAEGALAQARADGLPMDDAGRIRVNVWAIEGETGAALASLIETVGGVADYVNDTNVEGGVPLAGIVALANAPQIAAIDLVSLATSTGLAGAPAAGVQAAPAGPVLGEGFDIISANDWHKALPAVTGTSQDIGLIDVGFSGAVDAGEYACMSGANPGGSSTHGAQVLQILCDVAPTAEVRLYRADTPALLVTAINSASTSNQIILIALDLGVDQGPGDGVGTGSPSAGVYTAINTATTNNDLVIASAGNNGFWTNDVDLSPFAGIGDVIGRYFSMTYALSAASPTINIPAQVYPNDVIRVSWNDWSDNLNGATEEDFDVKITGDFALTINNASTNRVDANPGEAYTVLASNCPAGPCDINIRIGGPRVAVPTATDDSFGDDGNVFFQVQVSGQGMMNRNDIAGATVTTTAGNLARPADADNAMAVGAVCARADLNYPRMNESSYGPVFTAGGAGVDTTPIASPFMLNQNSLKPLLVGPTDVSVVGNPVTTPSINGCRDGDADGFSGTSAAAAYVAAQAALIRSNTDTDINPAGQTEAQKRDTIIRYLLSHSIDLFEGPQPNGFDAVFGAGLTLLGNPTPDYPVFNPAALPINPPTPASGDPACPSFTYVANNNPQGANLTTALGSATNPHIHPADALADAPANGCVVLLPGEYVGGIFASNAGAASGIRLRSYDSANAGFDNLSAIWANNDLHFGSGASIYIESVNLSVEGFVFKAANPFDKTGDVISFARPFALQLVSSSGNNVTGNTISGFGSGNTDYPGLIGSKTPLSTALLVTDGQNVTIQNNTFMANDADNGAAIRIENSGTTTPVTIQRNFFKDNDFSGLSIANFNPTIKIFDARVNIYNNRFNTNSTKSIILVDDNRGSGDFSGPEAQVFGNAFTLNTNSGPVVHLNPGRNFRFINNTVAGNKSIAQGNESTIILIGIGPGSPMNGDAELDIHNNIFYDNSSGSLVTDLGAQSTCDSNNGGTENGARENWSFDSGGVSGPCENSFPIFNNSIESVDPATTGAFVGTTISPDDPYQQNAIAYGINNSDEALISLANPALLTGVDALGKQRDADGTVDLGAYEFKPVTAGPNPENPVTRTEDYLDLSLVPAPTKPVISIPLVASGGFGGYGFEIVSGPQNYSTDIGNACGGQPIYYDAAFFNPGTNEGRALYCPPRHFYNVGIVDPLAVVSFQYRVRDGAGNTSPPYAVTVNITTNNTTAPQRDTVLSTPMTFSSVGVLTEPPSGIPVRLRPYARFGNFRLAAPGDPALLVAADNTAPAMQAQYPYTFSTIGFPNGIATCGDDYNPTLFGASEGASQGHLSTQFGAISGGVMTVTPITGQIGCFPINYTAVDNFGQDSLLNVVRIVVVGSLPDEGLHDDTSFSFDYFGLTDADVGSWSPIYNEGTINNTLHQSIGLNDTASFLFDGVGFALYMQGSTLGGAYEVKVENAGVPVTLSWGAVPGVTGQLQSTVGGLTCRTSATAVALQPSQLTNYNVNQPYVVSCSGFLDGEANKVQVVNKVAAKQLNVDAIGILTETDPLQPGVHEVTEAQLLPTFFTGWTRETVTAAVGQRVVSANSTTADFTFRFQGTGFALGTALQRSALVVPLGQPLGVRYTVCVADTADPTNKVCQNFDNGLGATTALLWKVYRPFNGFDPTKTYDVSVNITNVPNFSGAGATAVKMKFYIDSIVVFNQVPTATLSMGTTEDDALGPIVFGGGLEDTWTFNTNNTLASNKSLTSIITTVPKVGPFINFKIPAAADTINWFQVSPTINTTKALICVDRPEFDLAPVEHGNCITMNTRTGSYFQLSNTGQEQVDTTPVATSFNPLLISESMFRTNWSALQPHNIEIFSLTNEAFNLDKIQVFDSDGPLTAGYYEENVRNLRWFTENEDVIPATNDYDLLNPGDFGHFTEVITTLASGGKLRQLSADSVLGIPLDTKNLYEGMFFQFNGTGFSVYFRLDTKADAVRMCWRDDGGIPATPTAGLIDTVLTTGTCQTFDNQSAVTRYKAARTIAGLAASNYSVVVQMLPDQNEPAAHIASALPITMAIDAVQVYNNALPVNVLNVAGTKYETSFTNQAADGRFVYLGAGWKSVTGTAANLYSGKNYDSILNVIGAGVVFQTNTVANVIIYRDTRAGFAPMQVCVIDPAPVVQRRCTIIVNNGGTGYQQPITVPLFDTTPHTVTIMTTDAGTFNLDAIGVANTPLQPGIYDENNPALVYSNTTNTQNPIYAHWKDIASTLYQDSGAMQSQLAATATPSASVSFQFVGTGFSLITQFDSLSGSLDLDIDGTGGNDYLNIPLSSYNAAAIYKSSHSITGLPQDTYTVTITENDVTTPTKRRRFTVDGVEIYANYDAARRLTPGFYDNAATNTAGNLYLLYGPSNTVWTAKSGTLASTSLNQTNHTATRYGAQVTFEVQNANAVTLFHSGSTSTAVQVCAVEVGTSTRTCETQTLVGKSNTTFTTALASGVGDYFVSVTNLKHGLSLIVDAVSAFDTASLPQGIYHDNNPGLVFAGPSWLAGSTAETLATDKFVKSTGTGNAGDEMRFTFTGTGFSIIVVESTLTSQNYTLCVDTGVGPATCPGGPVTATNLAPVNATAAKRAVALTYVGLTSATYSVVLINNDTTKPLLVDRVDILGNTTPDIGNTVTGNIENTDARIVYFPFFTFSTVANVAASGGNQHTGAMQGSVAYFELDDTASFEYVRQTLATYGSVQVCSGAFGTVSSDAAPACQTGETLRETVLNTGPLPVGYQKSEPVTIPPFSPSWVILRNENGKIMPLDFIRPTVGGAPLTAGYYEETHPELQYIGTFNPVTATSASGGTTTATTTPLDALLFEFTGTGFSTYFTFDSKADAVQICWRSGSGDLTFSQGGTCTTYDNQSVTVRYKAARTILGLAQGSYTASVQMLNDNGSPAVHTATGLPLTMQIDAVQIHDDALPTTVLDDTTKRYETSYVNRVNDKTFLYYGTGWTSFSGTAYKLYSGSNYDRITGVVGAGVVFQTNNANSIVLYRQTAAGYTPVEVCATRIDNDARTCTTVANNGSSGYQQAVGVSLNPGYTGPQRVSIVTLEGGIFALDAIQIVNTNGALVAGYYENSYPSLRFTNNAETTGGAWTTVFSTLYSGGSVRQTNVPGASGDILRFTFTGTGFEIGTGIDRYGGEMEVCYGTASPTTCYLYQNESTVISNLVSRSVTGLPSNTYQVRVRHADDGNQITAPVGPRIATYTPSRLRIDYVRIYDAALPPVVTQSGLYNEDATSGGVPFLQLQPADRWATVSGTAANLFSNKTYVNTVDSLKRTSALYAGPSATLRVQVPAGGATVVLYTGAAISTNTNRLLVCAQNVSGTDTTPVPPAGDCTIVTDLRTVNQIVLNNATTNPYKLPALGGAGTVNLTFRALTPGLFRIDGFQLIQGTTLTAGIYDDFLFGTDALVSPVQVANVGAGVWTLVPATTTKLASAYGGTQALAQSTNAITDDPTLSFQFLGTGFSIITTADSLGVDMRICYAAVDGFDLVFDGVDTSVPIDRQVEGCDTVTTDTVNTPTTDWATKNGNQPKPAIAYQYGYTIHGLKQNPGGGPDNSYRVQVTLIDTVMLATDRLKIDAIAIFSDILVGGTVLTSGAPMVNGQFYDNANAGLRYEPASFWSSNTTLTGPTTGPWNRTEHVTSKVGAIVQFNMNGNGFILYQSGKTTDSKYVRVCVRTNLGEECSEFSQYVATKYFTPIAFYGFGTGVDHEVVIENRDHGRFLSIDGLKIIP